MANKIEGEVVSISPAGNLITDVNGDVLTDAPRDDQTVVRCDDHETVGIYDSLDGQPEATFLAFLGETGALELTIVGMNASELLGIKVGAPVAISW